MNDAELLVELEKYFRAPEELHKVAGVTSHHIKLHKDIWALTQWKKGTKLNPQSVVTDNERLLYRVYRDILNGGTAEPRPIKLEIVENVILLQGMRESIDRDINVSATDLDFASLGNSSTAENETQTDLIAEFTDTAYARKVFSTEGSRARLNQTMKLGMLWDDTSFDATPRTIKESGIHWNLTAANTCHARVVSTDFILNAGDLFVVQVNELQENGTL